MRACDLSCLPSGLRKRITTSQALPVFSRKRKLSRINRLMLFLPTALGTIRLLTEMPNLAQDTLFG